MLFELEVNGPEHGKYARVADGPNGTLTVLDKCNDVLDDVKGCLAVLQSKIDGHHAINAAANASMLTVPGLPRLHHLG